ncbi:MAG: hypothetical protein F4Z35_05125 [Dehalococcoidia bacterium]|nr:hypothetical protein [Dehalococcoidia bacterium]
MKLPNRGRAYVAQEKITLYLLSHRNPRGRGKARFFSAFGFRIERWLELAEALRVHGATHEVTETLEVDSGVKYIVDGVLDTPDGRNPLVRTVWMVDVGNSAPRFITAYPNRRR